MSTRQERVNTILHEMQRRDTVSLLRKEVPNLLALAAGKPGNTERADCLEYVLQQRGEIPQPPERPSERAMRLSVEHRPGSIGISIEGEHKPMRLESLEVEDL